MKKFLQTGCLVFLMSAGSHSSALDLQGGTLAELFDLLDTNNDYYLTYSESQSPLSGGLSLVFSALDDDGDGRIHELEFFAFALAN